MLNNDQLLFFQQHGYLIIPDVFPMADLEAAENILQGLFTQQVYDKAPCSNAHIISDLYRFAPELLPLLFTEKYFTVIRDLLGGQASWVPECAVHRDRFFGWHKDSAGAEKAGMRSHRNYPHPMLTAAVYFQDNGPAGGGLTVAAGTHREPDHTIRYYSKNWLLRGYNKVLKLLKWSEMDRLERHPGYMDLPSRKGDLVVFDIRLSHRATYPGIKPGVQKLAIFNAFVRDDATGREFLHFQKQRQEQFYAYFRSTPPPACVYEQARTLGMKVMY